MDQYKDANNEIVSIFSEDVNFYTLSNGVKIKKDLFERKFSKIDNSSIDANNFLNQQTPVNVINKGNQLKQEILENYQQINTLKTNVDIVDPIDFLNQPSIPNANQILTELSNVDTSRVVDVPESMRRQITHRDAETGEISDLVSLEDKKKMLIQEYNKSAAVMGGQKIEKFIDQENNEDAVDQFLQQGQPQQKSKILNENGLSESQEKARQEQILVSGVDPFADKVAEFKKSKQKEISQQIVNEKIKTPNIPVESFGEESTEDDAYKFFKNFKRNFDIELNVKINEKIAEPEFLKLMSNNFEADVLKFYSKEILKTILSDITSLEDNIYNQLHKIVFNKPVESQKTKPTIKKPTVKKQTVKKPTVKKNPNK